MQKWGAASWNFGVKQVLVRGPGSQNKTDELPVRTDVFLLRVELCPSKRDTEALTPSTCECDLI